MNEDSIETNPLIAISDSCLFISGTDNVTPVDLLMSWIILTKFKSLNGNNPSMHFSTFVNAGFAFISSKGLVVVFATVIPYLIFTQTVRPIIGLDI